MWEKPTLLLLHGGPGFDHTAFKEAFSSLSDVAQAIFYDHRGNGRSDGNDPATWNLAQWADDVKGLCDALGIVQPVVCGLSFGGFVAQAYATRYPDHPGKLILLSTAGKIDFPTIFAAFTCVGGPEIGAVAESYWMNPAAEGRARYFKRCVPFYEHDPIAPMELAEATAAAIPAHLLHFERLVECGHDIHGDDPQRVSGAIRTIISSLV